MIFILKKKLHAVENALENSVAMNLLLFLVISIMKFDLAYFN